jgi:hypothetical protein
MFSATDSREFDMLNGFFFPQDPALPGWITILHGTQDDLGNLEARFSQAYYVVQSALV